MPWSSRRRWCCRRAGAGGWRRSAAAPVPSSSWVAGRRRPCSPRSPGGAPVSSCSSRSSSPSCRRTARRRARCWREALPRRPPCSLRRCRSPRARRRRTHRRNPPTRVHRPIADRHPAYVLLEDGAWFPGTAPVPFEPTYAEVVFTTNLSGYQEVFTDPSYLGQIVVMTAPMIGNYGINPDDIESDRPRVAGVVVPELSVQPSNWRSTGALADWLAAPRVPLVADEATRQLTRHLRSKGAMRGARGGGAGTHDAARPPRAAGPPLCGVQRATRATTGAAGSGGPPR